MTLPQLPQDIIKKIYSFGIGSSFSNSLLNELEIVISQRYWEKPDNGRCWDILPYYIKQKAIKNKLLTELVSKEILGVHVWWDILEEPTIEIWDFILFSESIRNLRKFYKVNIQETFDKIKIGGKMFKIITDVPTGTIFYDN